MWYINKSDDRKKEHCIDATGILKFKCKFSNFLFFRFKTNKENGIILYSRGSQGDHFALQLVENRLLLNVNLGHTEGTSMALGSQLDDNIFHEIMISRERRDVVLSVDRVRIRDR